MCVSPPKEISIINKGPHKWNSKEFSDAEFWDLKHFDGDSSHLLNSISVTLVMQ